MLPFPVKIYPFEIFTRAKSGLVVSSLCIKLNGFFDFRYMRRQPSIVQYAVDDVNNNAGGRGNEDAKDEDLRGTE